MVQKKIESLRESLRKNFNEIQTAIRTNKPFEVKVKMNRLAALMIANTMTADLKKTYAVDGWLGCRSLS